MGEQGLLEMFSAPVARKVKVVAFRHFPCQRVGRSDRVSFRVIDDEGEMEGRFLEKASFVSARSASLRLSESKTNNVPVGTYRILTCSAPRSSSPPGFASSSWNRRNKTSFALGTEA